MGKNGFRDEAKPLQSIAPISAMPDSGGVAAPPGNAMPRIRGVWGAAAPQLLLQRKCEGSTTYYYLLLLLLLLLLLSLHNTSYY